MHWMLVYMVYIYRNKVYDCELDKIYLIWIWIDKIEWCHCWFWSTVEGSSDFIWWHPGETGLASWKRTQAERHFRWQLWSCHASVPGCCPWTMTGFCERVRQLVSPCRPSFYNPCRHVGMTFSKIHFPKSRFWHLYKNIPTFCRSFQMWRTWEKPWRGSSAEVRGAEFGWETLHVFRGALASQKIAMMFSARLISA